MHDIGIYYDEQLIEITMVSLLGYSHPAALLHFLKLELNLSSNLLDPGRMNL